MTDNSYFGIAENDYRYIIDHEDDIGKYNNTVVLLCQQCVEKYMKSLLEKVACNEKELKTHKLESIIVTLRKYGVNLELDMSKLMLLSRFYIGARYPGEDFVDIDTVTTREMFDLVTDVKNAVIESMKSFDRQEHVKNIREALNGSSGSNPFDSAIKAMENN